MNLRMDLGAVTPEELPASLLISYPAGGAAAPMAGIAWLGVHPGNLSAEFWKKL